MAMQHGGNGTGRRRFVALLSAVGLAVGLSAASIFTVQVISPAPAVALDNGLARTPPMGFNDWNAFGCNVSEALIKQTADFFVSSGMKAAGYEYVNIDDCWMTHQRDASGRLVPDPTKFPDGIAGTAAYVHSKGLKLGIYEDAGTATCAGYPGSLGHEQVDARTFADWGVDYLKYDNCNTPAGTADTQAEFIQRYSVMRDALAATGRPIVYSICEWGQQQPWTWAGAVGNLWRTTGDISDNWNSLKSIVNQNAPLAQYAGPGAWNDPDMLEVGNGGMTDTEYRSHFSLWAEMAAPLLVGTDLRKATPATMAIYLNRDVIAVDQDPLGAQGRVIKTDGTHLVFAKPLAGGDVAVALFNEGDTAATMSTSASALSMPASGVYYVKDLWSHQSTETVGQISATVPAHGTVMYRVTTGKNPTQAAPNVSLDVTGLSKVTPGQPSTATVTFTDNGVLPAQHVQLSLSAPAGWTVTATSATSFGAVESGQTVQATFQVVAPEPNQLFQSDDVTATAAYQWGGKYPESTSVTTTVVTSPPVKAPYQTYSSATDAPAWFAESGQQFGISGAGADLYSGSDSYSTIYYKGAVGTTSTIDTEVVSQQNLTGYGKAGIIVRNDMTGSGTTPEGVILIESPSGGIQMEWNNNGGTYINSVTPPNGTNPESLPVHLKLERSSSTTYNGYYSFNGTDWITVGSATVPGQAATQDAGMFVTSHATGSPATVIFDGFAVADGAVPPPPAPKSYEAEAATNTIAGGARVSNCSTCSGGKKVGYVGNGGTLTFNGVTAPSAGNYRMTIAYLNGPPGRQATVSVDGGTPQTLSFTPTTDFNTVGTMNVTLALAAGNNTIQLANPSDWAPDFDRILVAAAPS